MVTIWARELFKKKIKLNHELCHTDHISRHLSLLVFLENQSEYFVLLLAPTHGTYISKLKKWYGHLDDGLG